MQNYAVRFPVSYSKPKLFVKNKIIYKMAKYSNNPSIHNMFPYVTKEPEVPGVGDDQILLGYAADTFDPKDGLVTIPFRKDRSFVGVVMAARGCGKCTSGDTDVFTDEGVFKAKNLLDCNVNTLSDDLKVVVRPCTRVVKKQAELIKLTTRHGYSLECTKDHKLLTAAGWKRTDELAEGDYIATPRVWDVSPKSLADLVARDTHTKTPLNIKLDLDFAYFVGLFLGDGSYAGAAHTGVRVTSADPGIIRFVRRFSARFGARTGKRSDIKLGGQNYARNASFTNRDFVSFLKNHGAPCEYAANNIKGPKSRAVFIHNLFLTAPKPFLARLISGVMDTDGTVGKNGQIVLLSASERLIETLQYALLRFRIPSFKRKRLKKYNGDLREFYQLGIYGDSALRSFQSLIGFNVPHKKSRLATRLSLEKKENLNNDVIPVPLSLINELTTTLSTRWDVDHLEIDAPFVAKALVDLYDEGSRYICASTIANKINKNVSKQNKIPYRLVGRILNQKLGLTKRIRYNHRQYVYLNDKIIHNLKTQYNTKRTNLDARRRHIRKALPFVGVLSHMRINPGSRNHNFPSPHNLKRVIDAYPNTVGCEALERLKILAYSDVLWDPVISLIQLPPEEVYDFQVDETHNFIGNGIVLHNSVLATNLALDNLLARFDVPCFFIDPSWEFSTRKYPQLNPDLVEKLGRIGLSPRGYPTKVFTPEMVSAWGNQGQTYVIDLIDFKRIGHVDAPAMLQSLVEFFEVDGASNRAAKRMFYPLVADLNRCPDSIFQFKREVNDAINSKRMSTVTGKPTGKKVSTILLDIIDGFTMSHRMGLTDLSKSVDFAKELAENRFVILQGSVGGASERFLSTYVKLAILTLVYDRARQIRQRSGNLKTGALVVIDEADKFAPEKTMIPSRTPIVELATRQRKLNMSILAITQKPQLLDQALVGEADFILCSKIATEEERAILRNRGVSKFDVNSVIGNLRQKVELPSGHTVSEWAYVDRNNQIKTFFPCPPRSAMFEEQAG